jgi:hypothetical protein
MKRSCQRQTLGFDTPARRITAAVPQPSAVARMIGAPADVLLRAVAVRHDRLEPSTVGDGDFDLDSHAHGDSLPSPMHQRNLLLDLIH